MQLLSRVATPLLHEVRSIDTVHEVRSSIGTDLFRIRGGGGGDVVADISVSLIVLIAVALAARSGSSTMAAVFSTAPTGVPLSLWLVQRASTTGAAPVSVAAFCRACIKGSLALAAFCSGALLLAQGSTAPSLAALLGTGYVCWAVAWVLLQRI